MTTLQNARQAHWDSHRQPLPYLYRASWSKDGSIAKSSQGQPSERIESAFADAHEAAKSNKSVTILKDDRGEFHPDNAGKFFLHRIIK
jgi:hypothetical protein